MNVTIHCARIGKPTRIFTEGLIEDDGVRLRTSSIVPPLFRKKWSAQWREQGLISARKTITVVRKFLFYREHFTIMQVRGAQGELLGHYCDIATPLQKINGLYHLTDLILDLWVYPDNRVRELDWDEFERAARRGLLAPEIKAAACDTLEWLIAAVKAGNFPGAYTEGNRNAPNI